MPSILKPFSTEEAASEMRVIIPALILLMTTFSAHAAQLGGYTVMANLGRAPQIEYIGTDGRLWLWYVGNQRIVRGTWKEENGQVCIKYEAGSVDAVTKRPSGKQCLPTEVYLSVFIDRVKGDTFGLEKRNLVPYPLPGYFKSIAALAKSGNNVDLPTAMSPDQCQAVVAAGGKSKAAALEAGMLLFHGRYMGKDCINVDYVRAFDFIAKSGDKKTYKALFDTLSKRAAQGLPAAVSALKRIKPPL